MTTERGHHGAQGPFQGAVLDAIVGLRSKMAEDARRRGNSSPEDTDYSVTVAELKQRLSQNTGLELYLEQGASGFSKPPQDVSSVHSNSFVETRGRAFASTSSEVEVRAMRDERYYTDFDYQATTTRAPPPGYDSKIQTIQSEAVENLRNKLRLRKERGESSQEASEANRGFVKSYGEVILRRATSEGVKSYDGNTGKKVVTSKSKEEKSFGPVSMVTIKPAGEPMARVSYSSFDRERESYLKKFEDQIDSVANTSPIKEDLENILANNKKKQIPVKAPRRIDNKPPVDINSDIKDVELQDGGSQSTDTLPRSADSKNGGKPKGDSSDSSSSSDEEEDVEKSVGTTDPWKEIAHKAKEFLKSQTDDSSSSSSSDEDETNRKAEDVDLVKVQSENEASEGNGVFTMTDFNKSDTNYGDLRKDTSAPAKPSSSED